MSKSHDVSVNDGDAFGWLSLRRGPASCLASLQSSPWFAFGKSTSGNFLSTRKLLNLHLIFFKWGHPLVNGLLPI